MRRTTAGHVHQTHMDLETNKRLVAWYTAATNYHPLDAAPQHPWASSKLLQRIRLGYSTWEWLREDFEGQECGHSRKHNHCLLVHHLLSCTATACLRPLPIAATQHSGQRLLNRREGRDTLLVWYTSPDMLLEVLSATSCPC